jgi:hypothetical protein
MGWLLLACFYLVPGKVYYVFSDYVSNAAEVAEKLLFLRSG